MKYLPEVLIFCGIQAFALFLYWVSGNDIARSPSLAWTLFLSTVIGIGFSMTVASRHIE